jgi:hypothetical protein
MTDRRFMMEMKRVAAAASAAVLALSGIASILVLNYTPQDVEAVELHDPGDVPGIRRDGDDVPALEAIPDGDDDPTGDGTGPGDDSVGATDDGVGATSATGDGDDSVAATDDGAGVLAATGDGDDTRGDDGTSGGNNTGDVSRDNSVSNSSSNG